MKKIYKISGSFFQDGKWSKPDPSFVCYVVSEDGSFIGYCDELYAGVDEINRTRYIIGGFAEEDDSFGFLKLSNYRLQTPLFYEVYKPSSKGINGSWSVLNIFEEYFDEKGKAKVKLAEVEYTEAEEARIREKFSELDKNLITNMIALGLIGYSE